MSETNHTLGKFCSVAKKGTIINPKKIPGYKEPKGQILKEDGQKINFVYTPIEYNISYDLAGGKIDCNLKNKYTIEDDTYIPGTPEREGFEFNGWEPKMIKKGNIGDIKFTATWLPCAILLPGNQLNEALIKLVGDKETIFGFRISNDKVHEDCVNLSSTITSILATFENGDVVLHCDKDIYCNDNMDGAFEGLTLLRDIDCFSKIICKEGTSINSIFKNCKLLSNLDSLSDWANFGNFKDFTEAFTGTNALATSRVPYWYRWNVCIKCISSSGKTIYQSRIDAIPGETIYAKSFQGYRIVNSEIEITSPDKVYTFEYIPVDYTIKYVLNGGEFVSAKALYTIEDETYYPPEPVKAGFHFTGWDRECITSGEIGNVVFIAQYELIK